METRHKRISEYLTKNSVKKFLNRRLVFCIIAFILLLGFIFSLPNPLFDVSYSPVLYDREGKLLGAQVASDGQWRFPGKEKVNEKFAIALIEAEDRRFYRHPGVDILAVARAAVQNIRGKKVISGGSTITMQTIRLSRGKHKRTYFEKAVEAFLAVRLEAGSLCRAIFRRQRAKGEILALYAANAPFGGNVVGLEAAAWRWFGRDCEDLSWAEAAALAVLPNSPSIIHPGRNRDALKTKRDSLLLKLYQKGVVDEETLNLSLAEPLPGEPLALPRLAPHLLHRLVMEKGAGAFNTAIERDIQERAVSIMNRATDRFSVNGIMNGACVIINTKTGETVSYVGNTETLHAPDVDIASSWRSSGSLLKPFLYAAMLDTGDIFPSSLVSDIPTRVGSFRPENITRTYLGVTGADEALARSLNVPAARSLRVYGVDRFARLLRSLGLTTLFRNGDDYGLPLVLGGAEVTLHEITGLYAALGRYVESRGEEGEQLISPGAAWLTLEALVWATRPGEEAVWQDYAGSRRIAWKTGTSYGFRDAWAIGVTPEWTAGVWFGNASGEGRPELRSAVTAAPVLFEIFSALDSLGGNRGTWFNQPAAQLRHEEVCASSGFPASVNCNSVKIEDVPCNAPALRACPFCRTVILNEAMDRRVTFESGSSGSIAAGSVATSSAPVVERKWFVLPPAEEWYYRRWNLDYKPLPPDQNGREGSAYQSIALFNPEPGSQIYVPRELDGSEGRIVFSAAHRDETGIIFWHLDGEYLGSTQNFHEMEARPESGKRTLTLVDSGGNTLSRSFTVLSSDSNY